jgi:hypothetical protein
LSGSRLLAVVALVVGGFLSSGCTSRDTLAGSAVHDLLADVEPASGEAVVKFCGDCHVPPDARTYPKGHWGEEVRRGFDFYEKSGRTDLKPPPYAAVVKYYQSLAPEQLEVPKPVEDLTTSPVVFRRQVISRPEGKVKPGVSHILAGGSGFYACDMISGQVSHVAFDQRQEASVRVLATVKAATHVEIVDLLGTGVEGLLVADIGDPTPMDHAEGGVYFFPALTASRDPVEGQERIDLLTGVSRVADAKAGDFNGDGLLDVVVAVFGYHETGSLQLLTRDAAAETPRFNARILDPRHGASHVYVHDLDGDGDLDLIVLHSQEFESIEAYINDGHANFTMVKLFSAPVPDFGCSSIELADVDGDQDMDIVLVNGDSMDSFLLKPHHGIHWLENRTGEQETGSVKGEAAQNLRFEVHTLAPLVGAYGAAVGDLDGDGDNDIVACAMTWDNSAINSLVWFEQLPGKVFKQHCLDLSVDQHPCIELGDFDGDGDLDIAVGEFDAFIQLETWSSVWWNEGLK